MRKQGLQGISREDARRPRPPTRPCTQDKVNRKFKADAPDQLWVADFTYVQNAMGMACAVFVIGLFTTEVVKHLGPWKTTGQLEWETMKWVHWYNKDRLHGAIGYQTPNEKENAFRQQNNELEKAA